jgi:hypothetical protein
VTVKIPVNFTMQVQIYYSSVPSTLKVRKDTTRVQDILSAKKIEFEMLDVASDEYGNTH